LAQSTTLFKRDELYLITAACFEHHHYIGHTPERMTSFEAELVEITQHNCQQLFAWVVLPNHYHQLVHTSNIQALLKTLGQLHGRSSYHWNLEEGSRGRQVWYRVAETAIKSERHFYATFNYVLHNAVRHGYVERWQDWPYSNAAQYLETVGREAAMQRWHEYPLLDYGKDWDPPEM
jgi:putative transposase